MCIRDRLKAKARFGLLLNVLTILFALAMWYLTRSGKVAFPALS